jgi:transposase-like protein
MDILYENLQEGKAMVAVVLKRPFCGSEDVRPYGTSNGKKRYACNNTECSRKTFYAEYTYNGCKPDVKKAIGHLWKLFKIGGNCDMINS